MANITLSETPGSALSGYNKTKEVSTTSTPFIEPVFSSIDRVAGPPDTPQNFNIAQLDAQGTADNTSIRGFLRGRRPFRGLLFPRGYYNR
jgi:hypothetical protein